MTRLYWSLYYQFEFVEDYGIFVARTRTHRVILRSASTIETDLRCESTHERISKRVALRAFRCDPMFEYLQSFIEQQAKHGWADTWLDECDDWVVVKRRLAIREAERFANLRKTRARWEREARQKRKNKRNSSHDIKQPN